ncbi:hypothetical protein WMY93_027746 [Mugilogobius chulae]|uniref:C-type lectin domain-containing protein n=1 Tax=Mugilogobius chulae TaxID=88201 RepID=A0AAW0MYG1_9GOBI
MTTDSNSWRWSAGPSTTSNYITWKPNDPNYAVALDTCVVLDWNGCADVQCDILSKAVCYIVESSVKHYFLAELSKMTWAQARDYCRQHYHDLAMIESLEEYQAVYNVATPPFWIGLSREPWRWSDKSNSNFKNWAPEEPNNNNRNEHCVAMGPELLWEDKNCELQMPFVCENSNF